MTTLDSRAKFKELVARVEAHPDYCPPLAFGLAICHVDKDGAFLDAYFAVPNFKENYGTAAVLADCFGYLSGNASYTVTNPQMMRIVDAFAEFEGDGKKHANIELIKSISHIPGQMPNLRVVATFIGQAEEDMKPASVPDVYLRLHLLSYRRVLPNQIGTTPSAIMPFLPNVAWTSEGPVAADEANGRILDARTRGRNLRVYGVDKLPHMCDYVVPSGVRIADTARVRLGAYLGVGTTVMPAGFVNFNAGTRGKAMIEGRVSQGVLVGDGSDLGGGSSTQGTMSGGSNVVVSIGERSLIGALAGVGISLGDDCIVAAGVYVMPSSDVEVYDSARKLLRFSKAHELSGENGLLFVRDGDGTLEVHPNKKAVTLNPLLHT
jgi:2,3,4,5-tetrahydropyridine-2-carboxylate N-succinyltransferase